MKLVLIGAGSRGMTYGSWAVEHGIQIAALAEPRPDRRRDAGKRLGVPEAFCFADAGEVFALGKIADAAVIATMDRDHYGHVIQALDQGYDILLEKPISPDPRECVDIERRANALGRKITVCHVLRYNDFFLSVKEILDSGELGKIVAIQQNNLLTEEEFKGAQKTLRAAAMTYVAATAAALAQLAQLLILFSGNRRRRD